MENKHSTTGLKKPCFNAEESLAGILGSPMYVTTDAAMVTKPIMDVTSKPLLRTYFSGAHREILVVWYTYGYCTFIVVWVMMMTMMYITRAPIELAKAPLMDIKKP